MKNNYLVSVISLPSVHQDQVYGAPGGFKGALMWLFDDGLEGNAASTRLLVSKEVEGHDTECQVRPSKSPDGVHGPGFNLCASSYDYIEGSRHLLVSGHGRLIGRCRVGCSDDQLLEADWSAGVRGNCD